MKKTLLSLFWILFALGSAYAQNQTISGTVTSDDGAPLPGVSVTIRGSRIGTQTNTAGRYSLSVPANVNSLVFSFIGYTSKTVTINGNTINVSLNAESVLLNDVIVVPYGTAKRETFVGSATAISAKDLQNRQVSNPLTALAGAVPGVQVSSASGQPGSAPTIRVRGFGSINSSNDPIYIVDGVQYENGISNISTDDIENISVLTDAASTSLYGAKAGNGVIIITTKKGKRGTGSLTFRASAGIIQRGVPEYDRVNAFQYYPLEWQAYRNSLVYPTAGTGLSVSDASTLASGLGTRNANNLQTFGGRTYLDISQNLGALVVGGVYTASNNPFNVASNQIVDVNGNINPNAQLRYNDLDWYQPLIRKGNRQNYGLSYSGANEKTDYYASLDYTNEQGFIIKSDLRRLSARTNINTQATKWFKTGINLAANLNESNQASADGGSSYINPIFFARSIGPVYNVYAHDPTTGAALYNADGTQVYDTGGLTALGVPGRASGGSPGRHILEETLLNENSFKRNVLSARTYQEISFLKYFKFTNTLSADYADINTSQSQNPIIGDGAPGGRATRQAQFNTTYNLQQLLNYRQAFGKHNIDALVGHESYSILRDVLSGMRSTQVIAGNTELVNYTTTTNLTSYKDRDRSEAYLSRVNYDYDQKYLISGSIRRDATSRFSSDVRSNTFGSVGIGWRLDREAFLQKYTWIDLLKLRASYGTTGNYQTLYANGSVAYYLYQSLFDINNNASEPGFSQQTTAGNPNLKWEVNKQKDIALEFGLFKNRINGTFEYFDRESSNLLFLVPLPVSSGVLNQYQNIGSMYNRGFEISLTGDVIRGKDFVWSMGINAATLKNKITKMPDAQPTIVTGLKQLAVGNSFYDYYTRIFAGVDPSDGSSLYVPIDGTTGTTIRTINGVNYTTSQTNAKLALTGQSALPKVYGGFTNNFRYKAFDLSVLFNYSLGGKIYDSNYQSLMSVASYGGALHVDELKAWQKPGDITDIPRLDIANSTNLNATSSRWLTNASYLYFRNASLGYNLPKNILAKVNVKNARIVLNGENLYLFSARKGLDPTNTLNNGNATVGVGNVGNSYSAPRIYSIGLTATL